MTSFEIPARIQMSKCCFDCWLYAMTLAIQYCFILVFCQYVIHFTANVRWQPCPQRYENGYFSIEFVTEPIGVPYIA